MSSFRSLKSRRNGLKISRSEKSRFVEIPSDDQRSASARGRPARRDQPLLTAGFSPWPTYPEGSTSPDHGLQPVAAQPVGLNNRYRGRGRGKEMGNGERGTNRRSSRVFTLHSLHHHSDLSIFTLDPQSSVCNPQSAIERQSSSSSAAYASGSWRWFCAGECLCTARRNARWDSHVKYRR